MATDTRPVFRLPWAGATSPDGAGETSGPGHPGNQPATDDASIAQEGQEPQMIEHADTADTAGAAEATPSESHAASEGEVSLPARRATKFMADLSRAMQVAAENARADLMARFEAEAKGVIEEVHASATDEAAGLRRKADDDVAAIRDWSKTEIARIREETDARIAARKGGLDGEMEQHAATVEARIQRVADVVASFESQMEAFFQRLNAEEDPTRIATMAETMPEPPSLADVAASIALPSTARVAPVAERRPLPTSDQPAEFDFAAAEAEAASFNADLEADDELPASENAETVEEGPAIGDEPAAQATPAIVDASHAEPRSSRIVVSGLVSVANIANFKRSLARTSGVSTIAVASGPEGDFIFTVGHTLGSALSASIVTMSGFDIQVTGESDEAITVAAQDRDATD